MSEGREQSRQRRYSGLAKLILLFFVACVVFVSLFGVALINCGGNAPTKP